MHRYSHNFLVHVVELKCQEETVEVRYKYRLGYTVVIATCENQVTFYFSSYKIYSLNFLWNFCGIRNEVLY